MNPVKQFEVSNVANNPSDGLWIPDKYTLVEIIEFSKTVKCVIFRRKTVMRISFSSFTFQNIFNFLNVGYQLVKNQEIEIIDKDENIGMNKFFLYWSRLFFQKASKTVLSFLKESHSRKLVLQGMSMGGAMAQCFYYHLKSSEIFENIPLSFSLNVLAFGSPRIGNHELGVWFAKYNDIVNYSICIEVDGKMMGDPVCYFPSTKYGYTNNHNLNHKHQKKEYREQFENIFSDTDISFRNFWTEWTFIRTEDLKVWNAVHNFDEYMTHV